MGDRHPFGGAMPDWVFVKSDDNLAEFSGGALLQFWNNPVSGTEYEDLTEDPEGTVPITALVSEDGTGDFELGTIPPFYGPPDVTAMWVSAEGGLRRLITSRDVGDLAGQALLQLSQHVAQQNGHGTTFDVLADTDLPDVGSRVDGSLVAWDTTSGKLVLVSETGLNAADFVQVAGGSTIRIPDDDTTTAAETIRIPSGSRTTNAWRVFWNAGSNGSPSWVETTWLDPFGHLRVQANADTRTGLKVLRKSSGATANIAEFGNESGTALAWVTADGRFRSPSVGRSVSFTKEGTVTTGVGKFRWANITGATLTIRALWFFLDTVASSGSSVFDVNLDGATLYPSGKPTITAGSHTTGILTAAFSVPAGAVLTVDVDSIGTSAADLSCQVDIV